MNVLTAKLKAVESEPYYRLLDYRGNAKEILDEFIRERDLQKLPQYIQESKSLNRFKPEYKWIKLIKSQTGPALSKRGLFLVAKPDNIDMYIKMSVEKIFDMFHDIDVKLQNSIPSIEFLAKTYGDVDSDFLFNFRDVIWKWTDMHFEVNPHLDNIILTPALFNMVTMKYNWTYLFI